MSAPGALKRIALPVLIMVVAMWALEVVDVLLRGRLDSLGIRSRTLEGLLGVPLSPFLHGGFSHLIANTVPFIALGLLVAWRSEGRIWPVTVTIGVVGGLGVWLLGPADTITIGASGLVFGLLGYLLTAGVITRNLLDIVIAGVVLVVYGGLLGGLLPFTVPAGVSWIAHLTGAVAGIGSAVIFAPRPQREPNRGAPGS